MGKSPDCPLFYIGVLVAMIGVLYLILGKGQNGFVLLCLGAFTGALPAVHYSFKGCMIVSMLSGIFGIFLTVAKGTDYLNIPSRNNYPLYVLMTLIISGYTFSGMIMNHLGKRKEGSSNEELQ